MHPPHTGDGGPPVAVPATLCSPELWSELPLLVRTCHLWHIQAQILHPHCHGRWRGELNCNTCCAAQCSTIVYVTKYIIQLWPVVLPSLIGGGCVSTGDLLCSIRCVPG